MPNKLNKEESFLKLAKARMPKALKMIKQIENLSNVYHYKYTEAQVKKMIGDIEGSVKDLKIEFEKGLRKQQNKNVIKQSDEYEL